MFRSKRERRGLTAGETALVRSIFGASLAADRVELRRWRWWPLQTPDLVMAPRGHIHFHARSDAWSADFAAEPLPLQAFFLHEMTHVWQHQSGLCLLLRRHPFCRYGYALEPGRPLGSYGIEQQAEIVRHAHLLCHGFPLPGKPPRETYDALLAGAFG